MQLLTTVDPANLHHIHNKKFENYVKGPKLHEIAEVLGDGILVTDSTIWNHHRNVAQSFLHHPHFHHSLLNVTWSKVKTGPIPVLDHVSRHGIEIDLQDIFLRFMYDTICTIMMDHDPKSLSIDFPIFPPIKAVSDLERVIFTRHILPTCIWKLLRWLSVGEEKKHKQAWKILDDFVYKCIDKKREERNKGTPTPKPKDKETEVSVDLLTLFMDKDESMKTPMSHNNNDIFLRDTITNFFLAGSETTSTALSWFFNLLSKNQEVAQKIKVELNAVMTLTNNIYDTFLRNFKDLSGKLIYLHAELCETLRLYPSLVFNPKTPVEPDILPSGHRVNPNTQIIINMHAMGRMKSIWGDDCNEFKPERWISEGGEIKHEPSYKFSVFSSGPRTCMGKQKAFSQMQIVAAIIIQNYHIQIVEGHLIPDLSMVLHIKNGCKV